MSAVSNYMRGQAYHYLKSANRIMHQWPQEERLSCLQKVFGPLKDSPIPTSPKSFRWTSHSGICYSVQLDMGVRWYLAKMQKGILLRRYVGQLDMITTADLERKAELIEAEAKELNLTK